MQSWGEMRDKSARNDQDNNRKRKGWQLFFISNKYDGVKEHFYSLNGVKIKLSAGGGGKCNHYNLLTQTHIKATGLRS